MSDNWIYDTAMELTCPTCKAGPTEECKAPRRQATWSPGQPTHHRLHVARQDRAVKKARESRGRA